MRMQPIPIAALLLVPSMLGARVQAQADFVVPSGTVLEYDTAAGPIRAVQVIIQQGCTLRAFGVLPLRIQTQNLVVDGTLDLSGFSAPVAPPINSANIPEVGALGGPGAGVGGTGSPQTTASSPQGGTGSGPISAPRRGGTGGESDYSPTGSPGQVELRRPGGGGGGALAADVPFAGSSQAPPNIGLQAQRGKNGHPQALGLLSLAAPPKGGPMGSRSFLDPDPDNDFFGQKLLSSGQIIQGELAFP